jgi:hypothetical protein
MTVVFRLPVDLLLLVLLTATVVETFIIIDRPSSNGERKSIGSSTVYHPNNCRSESITIILLSSLPSSVDYVPSTSSRRKQKREEEEEEEEPLPPPWSFQAKHVYYQFRWMKTKQVRKYNLPKDLFLFAFGEYTVGGIFCITYDKSPIGSYNEIAILSGLVCSTKFPSVSVGAWASHIFVDSVKAVKFGKQYWGLPAFYTSTISGMDADIDNNVANVTKTKVIFGTNNDKIEIDGWTGREMGSSSSSSNVFKWLDISLPSLSGCLPLSPPEQKETSKMTTRKTALTTALLQYPLRIQNPKSIRYLSKDHPQQLQIDFMKIDDDNDADVVHNDDSTTTALREIRELLKDSKTMFSIVLDDIFLEAGVATEL